MAGHKSVVIKLTSEQRHAIKRATGKDIAELKVDAFGGGEIALGVLEPRKAPTGLGGGESNESRKAPFRY
jgi:hypothetical protein